MLLEPGDVVAIRYGASVGTRAEQFYRYGAYRQPDGPLAMDFFFWAVRTPESVVLIDSGFDPAVVEWRPGRECVTPPVEALRALGVDPDQVSRVVVTHAHYDHIGNLSAFPEARFTVQRRELDFWTGPYGKEPACAASVESAEIAFLADAVRAGRVDFVDGDAELAPGIRGVLSPGHCPGQQMIEIATPGGGVLLCSDALHVVEEMERNMPFHVFTDLVAMYETFDRIREYARSGWTVVAGHDPQVMSAFPVVPGAEGLAVKVGSTS